ncbi:hypothetical protein DQ04_02751060 [Trypanosoma grayi]|uniref:hypothetical protein n=1 Tax=Trypanosoma grayi TaxID=71804 RepID=UPI0004F3F256|nr:hypothetical protein DQ04_02751060 [Trypanosoma grayi]KEG11308.1 hypothetical protein DQ04_02751060 [Trypanosoma grayi]
MQCIELTAPTVCVTTRSRFQDMPYELLMLWAEFASVREVLLVGTLNRFFREFTMPDNVALWRLFTERVLLLHPPGLKCVLFNDSLLRIYATVNNLPVALFVPRCGKNSDDGEDDVGNEGASDPSPPYNACARILTTEELQQWVVDRCEEVVQDLRTFADIIRGVEPRFALTGLLLALQAVKKRMWCTEVMDVESVRDLLRATVVEEEHDLGWSVLRAIARRDRAMPKRFAMRLSVPMSPDDLAALSAERQMFKKRWKFAASVAREYLQLREVLRVVLAVSEVSDHPSAQQRYDSVWSALRGTSAMLNAEKQWQQNQSGDLDEEGASIPMNATGDELLQQIRDLNKVTVGGIASYFFGYVFGKAQRKIFLSALFSMKHLAGAERYENISFW